MYKAFRKDPKYLTNYHMKSALTWITACVMVGLTRRPDQTHLLYFLPALLLLASTHVGIVTLGVITAVIASYFAQGFGSPIIALGLLALSVPWALFATAILHNAAHGNIKPRWLCRAVGEVFGLLQLVGFPDWVVIHVIHHAHPDDPEKDPHPPLGQTFWKFMLGMRASILKVLLREYLALWGQTAESKRQLTRLMLASKVEQVAKITFCLLLFGPHAFAWFFAPSIVFKMIHYAWFNWATHVQNGKDVVILNRTTALYKIANIFSIGLYYHQNHHKNPKLFHPGRMTARPREQDESNIAA